MALVLLFTLAPQSAGAQTAQRCFTETSFCISGRIREFWEQNGGLAVFGLPIGPQQQVQIEGQPSRCNGSSARDWSCTPKMRDPTMCCWARWARIGWPQQGRDWFTFPKSRRAADCRFFPETGHNVCGDDPGRPGAPAAWSSTADGQERGREPGAVWPAAERCQTETSRGQGIYSVQWFERARFELHPENQPPYNVLLGRLGAEVRSGSIRYILPGNAVFPEGVAYQPSAGAISSAAPPMGRFSAARCASRLRPCSCHAGADGRTTATGLKVDSRGRLFVSGGSTGQMFVYDTANGTLLGKVSNGLTPTFINDVAVTSAGDAYFTNSKSPIMYRVFTNSNGDLANEVWINFTNTPLQYQQGFNLNGIAITDDGKYIITVQSNTGKLYRIAMATKEIEVVNLGSQLVTNGDGILLDGHTLYVVRNQNGLIVKIQLADDYASGRVISNTSNPLLAYPTTAAKANDRLLVVNSQFNKRGPNLTPILPFTITSIPLP